MKITKAHYDFYTQRKIKSLGGYSPVKVVSIHDLIPSVTLNNDKHNDMHLLKLVVKNNKGNRQGLINRVTEIACGNSGKNRKRLFAKVLNKLNYL